MLFFVTSYFQIAVKHIAWRGPNRLRHHKHW